jgi:hypothetical protein
MLTGEASMTLHARRWLVLAVGLAASFAAQAQDGTGRLRLAALAEEGDLLLEEIAQLEPIRKRDSAEAERLAASEKKLAAEVANVEKEVKAYNKAVADLTQAAAAHAAECPGSVPESALEQCNESGGRLMDRTATLDRQYTSLQARQRDINAQVEQHNRAREAWRAARRENAARLDTNAADTQRWVNTARSFMTSSDFLALQRRAGQPAACARVRPNDVGAHFGEQGLRQLHACLKAVLRGL